MKKAIFLSFAFILFSPQLVTTQGTKNAQYPLVVQGDIPLYPAVAKTAHVSGSVRVRVTVKDGEIISTDVTFGNPLLASAAIGNIKTWKFNNTTNASFTTTFTYELEKEETAEASNPKIELELPTVVRITAKPTKGPCHDCGSDILAKPIRPPA
jgi:outer membrane biosynthesis protein TonB